MSGIRSLSPWWALLLPAAAIIAWFACGMPVPRRAPPGNSLPASARPGPPSRAGAHDLAGDTVALAAISPAGVGENPAADASPTIDPSALYSAWTSYADAIRQANDSGKPVLLDFNAAWSEPCKAQARDVFDTLAAGFTVRAAVIPVSVTDRAREDGHNPAGVAELERRFQIEAFPTLVVFSPVTGRSRRTEGYNNAAESLRWITEAADAVR